MASAAGVVDYDAATECVAVVSASDAQQTARVVCVDPLARNAGDLFLATARWTVALRRLPRLRRVVHADGSTVRAKRGFWRAWG